MLPLLEWTAALKSLELDIGRIKEGHGHEARVPAVGAGDDAKD